MFDTLLQEFRYALRGLLRSSGFAAVAVLTLALGIGATTALFTVVNGVLLRPLPYPEPDRLALLYSAYPQRSADRGTLSLPDYRDWSERSRTVERMAVYSTLPSNLVLASGDGARELSTAHVSWDFFATLAVEPALGRAFAETDEHGDVRQVVLSHAAWQNHFGRDAAIVGRTVTLSDRAFRVTGVMPPHFGFPNAQVEAWVPLAIVPESSIPMERRYVRFLNAVARLAPGVTAEQAGHDLSAVAATLEQAHPEENAGLSAAAAVPLREAVVGNVRTALIVLFGAVGFILLIACVNVANLLLARGADRARELAVRLAVGAGRRRLVRMLLAEGVMLAALAGVLGGLLAVWGVDVLLAQSANVIPRLGEIRPDARVLAFASGICLLTVVAFGLFPALAATRIEPAQRIKADGGDRVVTRSRARSGLVAAEVAIAIVLLIGAGLLLRSFWSLNRVDPGFRADNALAVSIAIPATRYPEAADFLGFHDALLERLRALPGVEAAGSMRYLPMRGSGETLSWQAGDAPVLPPAERPTADMLQVTPDLFRALGVPVLRGRAIEASDPSQGPLNVVVNETLARRAFADADPVGRTIRVADTEATVVGVVGDIRQRRLDAASDATIYVSLQRIPRRAMGFVLRTAGDPLALSAAVERTIRELDPSQAITELTSLEAIVSGSVDRPRFFAVLLASFAALAIALAAIGIYSVLLFTVRRRNREIGIRTALGAAPGRTVRLVLRQGMTPVLAGIGIGVLAAAALAQLLGSLLFAVTPLDPLTYAAVAAAVLAVALLAAYLPARRAAGVDPMIALRSE